MSEYAEYSRELEQLKRSLYTNISQVPNLTGTQRQEKCKQIESDFTSINDLIKEINQIKVMWDSSESSKMSRTLQDLDFELSRLENQYRDAQNRESLFAGSTRTLDGGGGSQRANLTNHRQEIQKGSQMVQTFNQDVSNIQEVGTGILVNLADQKEKMGVIDNRLDDLGSEITIGEKMTDRMLCRQKRRTALIWIAIVIVVIIFLSVFLYFVFRP